MAHAYNPSYSGGGDKEDRGSKPAQAEFARPYLKNFTKKKTGGVAQGEVPEFKSQYHKKKKVRIQT
jgi:hypothetical protein